MSSLCDSQRGLAAVRQSIQCPFCSTQFAVAHLNPCARLMIFLFHGTEGPQQSRPNKMGSAFVGMKDVVLIETTI